MTSFGAWSYVETCYKIVDIGISRTTVHWSEYMARAPPSGVYLQFAFLFGCIGHSDSNQRIYFGFGFSIGLIIVVMTNCFLWTGDVMYLGSA
jgi:formate/nitrite transporter FocA (FNT family)